MSSVEEIFKMFDNESQKLVTLFDDADSKNDMDIEEIVETYYQVMNTSSMASVLKQQADSEEFLDKIQATEKLISERFDSSIHPKIVKKLSLSIRELTATLQSGNCTEKSKEQTELYFLTKFYDPLI